MSYRAHMERMNYWGDNRVIEKMADVDADYGLTNLPHGVHPSADDCMFEDWDEMKLLVKRGSIYKVIDVGFLTEEDDVLCVFLEDDDFSYWYDSSGWTEEHIKLMKSKLTDVVLYSQFIKDNLSKLTVRRRNMICPSCDGEGRTVRPCIDAGGLSYRDFAEDPDFAEMYWSGRFDRDCQLR